MPQHPVRRPTRASTFRRSWLSVLLGATLVPVLLVGCGSESERPLPVANPPAASTLTPEQILREAQRALAQASSVRVTGDFREAGKPVKLDMRILAGDRATGTVVADGSTVELRRVGDQLFVKGDDKFLAALGPKAQATKGKWLVGPIAQADRGLANLTDLERFAQGLTPGTGKLTKEPVKPLNGKPAVGVLSSIGARVYVADMGTPFPLRVERIGELQGVIDYGDYNAAVDVQRPGPTVDLATVSS